MNSTKLNLGCGKRFLEGWINVDFTSTGTGVIATNLRKGIPFPNGSFDFVYHSHVLEHFEKNAAADFLKECFRVLRPSGVLRVVVPDLEVIASNYLVTLERASAGIAGWDHNYEWMLLEMYDQAIRNKSGGEMARYLLNESIPNEQFVIDRCGAEVRNIIEEGRRIRVSDQAVIQRKPDPNLSKFTRIFRLLRQPGLWREELLRRLLGDELEALQIGRFRLCGESHQWMYDSYSLSKLLLDSGFKDVAICKASESYIPEWKSYNLDTEADGSVYKPDSLFIEAQK